VSEIIRGNILPFSDALTEKRAWVRRTSEGQIWLQEKDIGSLSEGNVPVIFISMPMGSFMPSYLCGMTYHQK
jgi:hypothetical protein